jgi:hypothetical protein
VERLAERPGAARQRAMAEGGDGIARLVAGLVDAFDADGSSPASAGD